jgi:hypothetical protein
MHPGKHLSCLSTAPLARDREAFLGEPDSRGPKPRSAGADPSRHPPLAGQRMLADVTRAAPYGLGTG